MSTDDTTLNTFDTLNTADLIDGLCASVDAARVSAEGDTRWLNAISAAWDHLLATETVEYRHDDHALSYRSESGALYLANGRCECEAFRFGTACAHRAAARLVTLALAWNEARELADLAAELVADAADAGCAWYDLPTGIVGAEARMASLRDFAASWDAVSAAQRTALAA